MGLDINWTTVIASAISSAIIGGTQFVSNRYLARMLDRIEKGLGLSKIGKNGQDVQKPRDDESDNV